MDQRQFPAVTHQRWDPEFVDKVLWEVAAAGGNVRRAYGALSAWAAQQAEAEGQLPDIPSERTVRDWVSNRYRNRYHEVQQAKVTHMDELIAQTGSRLAIELADAEERALGQTLAGLANANATEASQILRNLSQSKKIQVDNAVQLRRQTTVGIDVRDLAQLASSLVRRGAAELAPPVIEAHVIED